MAQRNAISHGFPGEPGLSERADQAGARFSVIAENVAMGRTAGIIHAEWMKSPPHRANLLAADVDSVGIAVAEGGRQLFAVEDFSQATLELTLEQQERHVGEPLKARGLRLLPGVEDARKTCALDHGFAGSRRALFMMRYETVDLNRLPDSLEKEIRTGRYHQAAVGACLAASQSGFVAYRIVVLLY
jgi:hypothetical protein